MIAIDVGAAWSVALAEWSWRRKDGKTELAFEGQQEDGLGHRGGKARNWTEDKGSGGEGRQELRDNCLGVQGGTAEELLEPSLGGLAIGRTKVRWWIRRR